MLFFPTVDEDVAYFRSQGYTGSINDMHYKAMGDLGYTGSLSDRIHAFLTFKYGSFYEAMRDLRNGTSVFSLITAYAANGLDPALVFDFIGNYFRKDSTESTITEALVHNSATAGNATMTDGYGPEQITNGDFASDSDWTKGTGWTISGGVATHSAGIGSDLEQSGVLTAGKSYVLTLDVTAVRATSTLYVMSDSNTYQTIEPAVTTGKKVVTFTAPINGKLSIRLGSPADTDIDNISVREAPAIKWRPHNLLAYSEDFSNSAWVRSNVTATSDVVTQDSATSGHYLENAFLSSIDGVSYTHEFLVEYVDWQYVSLGGNLDGGNRYVIVDLVNQTITETGAGVVTSSIEVISATKVKVKVSAPDVSSNALRSYVGFSNSATPATRFPSFTGDGVSSVRVDYASLYRSDLGGMVNNPETGDSYVPTTSTARYLPRVGHHIYNGSAWVNEGVLHESEARTNLVTNSNSFTTLGTSTVTANSGVSPTGETNAVLADTVAASNSNGVDIPDCTINADTSYTTSLYVKNVAGNGIFSFFFRTSSPSNQTKLWFNLNDGTKGTQGANGGTTSVSDFGITEVGNGWYRLYVVGSNTVTTSLNSFTFSADADNSSNRDGAGEVLIYGAQVEEGSTPSSYIPTAGAAVTRAAETLTVPAANMPWPTVVETTGTELADFSVDGSHSNTGQTAISTSGSDIVITYVSGGPGWGGFVFTGLTVGYVYSLNLTALGTYSFLRVGTNKNNGANLGGSSSGEVRAELFTASATTHYLNFGLYASSGPVTVSALSVKEINPLSVSIQMDGRMTYADTGGAYYQYLWQLDGANRVRGYVNTFGTYVGRQTIAQEVGNVEDQTTTAGDYYSPSINVPFNIAARHGSTFINGAVDGTALTANLTPTALPYLQATDFQIGTTFMGTIGGLRVWADDLGDTGIVEATAPSLEPSLSLTFDGSETSFTVLDWSE